MKKEIVLCLSDLHAPYHHPEALAFLKYCYREFKPTKIVCLGDEVDAHGLSVHPKIPELYSAGHEYEAAMEFMGQLYKLFPEVMVCISNHTHRPWRVAQAAGLPSVYLKSYRDIMQAPAGWVWKDRWEIDDVVYEHGDPCSGRNGAYKAAFENRKSTVIGHIHSFGGVQYSANHHNQIFWANAGCLIDTTSLAFAYGNKYRNKATLGTVVVDHGLNAHFVRLNR
jgi:hypothetical protein